MTTPWRPSLPVPDLDQRDQHRSPFDDPAFTAAALKARGTSSPTSWGLHHSGDSSMHDGDGSMNTSLSDDDNGVACVLFNKFYLETTEESVSMQATPATDTTRTPGVHSSPRYGHAGVDDTQDNGREAGALFGDSLLRSSMRDDDDSSERGSPSPRPRTVAASASTTMTPISMRPAPDQVPTRAHCGELPVQTWDGTLTGHRLCVFPAAVCLRKRAARVSALALGTTRPRMPAHTRSYALVGTRLRAKAHASAYVPMRSLDWQIHVCSSCRSRHYHALLIGLSLWCL